MGVSVSVGVGVGVGVSIMVWYGMAWYGSLVAGETNPWDVGHLAIPVGDSPWDPSPQGS